MRYLIRFCYDGSNYSGFQRQKGLKTIQEELENAVTKVNGGKKTTITATGRTDKGVHALEQYAHVDIDVKITPKNLKRALNSSLPDDIFVLDVEEKSENFHARYQVKEKTYKYIINIGEYNPIERNYVFQYNYNLDVDEMKKGIKYFLGEHDFRAFMTENKDKDNCIRKITKASIKVKDNKIILTFTGNGFLRYQVRNMVGLLIKIGEKKLEPSSVKTILDSKDRSKSGKTAPPTGLYLSKVKFKNA